MDKLFLTVLNMSATGAFVIAAVMLARLPLKKAPKWISYALWAVAAFRLVCPFTFESVLSLVPRNVEFPEPSAEYIVHWPPYSTYDGVLQTLPLHTADGITDTRTIYELLAPVWLAGIAIMLIYSVVSIILLHRRLRGAALSADGVYEAENLKTPFVIGLFRPRIYIPSGISGEERRYIVLHERTHIRRRDHIVKMFAYYALCLHWFNPLAWAAFWLCGADMEMSCDERVLKELGGELRCDYSMSLVRAAANRRIWNGSPLAFGEGGMKERVKNVLNFRKPSRIIVVAAIALAAALTIGFAVNGTARAKPVVIEDSSGAQIFELDADNGGKMTLYTDAITQMRVTHVIRGESTGYGIADKTSIADICDWVGGLSIKREYFADGQTPGNSDGGEGYSFKVDGRDGLVGLFAYGIYGSGECYVICGGTWYKVKNPSDPPIPETDMIDESSLEWSQIPEPSIESKTGFSWSPGPMSSSTTFSATWAPIEDLPLDYGKDEAVADGIYINIHGSEIYNQKLVDVFYESVFAGNSAYMRTMVYTIEGDPIIVDYQFDGNSFTVIHDARRDKFGSQEITSETYRYLVPLDRSRPAGEPTPYYLSNEPNIYTETGNGGTMLIEDLGPIPSPSDSVPIGTVGNGWQSTDISVPEPDPLEDIKMWKFAVRNALQDTFVFDESGVTFTIPESVMTVNGYPVPVKIAIEVDGLDSSIGDPNYAILGGMSIEKDEIIAGSSFSFPLWNIGGKGAHFAVTFDDGETQYYSPLYEDWRRENEE
jgi:beta-lactamase regulating signal transducer with metallopeptidase domain